MFYSWVQSFRLYNWEKKVEGYHNTTNGLDYYKLLALGVICRGLSFYVLFFNTQKIYFYTRELFWKSMLVTIFFNPLVTLAINRLKKTVIFTTTTGLNGQEESQPCFFALLDVRAHELGRASPKNNIYLFLPSAPIGLLSISEKNSQFGR